MKLEGEEPVKWRWDLFRYFRYPFSNSTNTPKMVVFTVIVYDSVFLFSCVLDPWQHGLYLYPMDVAVDKNITSLLMFMLIGVLQPQYSTLVHTFLTSGFSSFGVSLQWVLPPPSIPYWCSPEHNVGQPVLPPDTLAQHTPSCDSSHILVTF